MEPGIGCSAEGALCDCDRVGESCQCVEYAQRVERGWIGVKGEVMNCDGWGSRAWVGWSVRDFGLGRRPRISFAMTPRKATATAKADP